MAFQNGLMGCAAILIEAGDVKDLFERAIDCISYYSAQCLRLVLPYLSNKEDLAYLVFKATDSEKPEHLQVLIAAGADVNKSTKRPFAVD